MRHVDWTGVQAVEGFDAPTPGAYIARIVSVTDVEEKEYLKIEWDFAEGQYKGYNQDTFTRAGFWPTALIRSYKDAALGFFKAFKTAVEASNPGYTFDDQNPHALAGKLVGLILGEEGYIKTNGNPGRRLYVAQTRSLEAIQTGDFKVPEFRPAKPKPAAPASWSAPGGGFPESDDDGDLPF